MIFTAQQARDNEENSVEDTLNKIYEKIKIVSKKDYDLTIVFGDDQGFEFRDAYRNTEEITENLEKAGYSVRWDADAFGNPTLYIDWRFPN
jgi:hypothetical protein